MRVRVLVINGLVLAAIGCMAAVTGSELRPARLLPAHSTEEIADNIADLESRAALAPTASSVAALARAYLDREQSGLASAAIESAAPQIRTAPEVAQLHSRALFHRGLSREALVV